VHNCCFQNNNRWLDRLHKFILTDAIQGNDFIVKRVGTVTKTVYALNQIRIAQNDDVCLAENIVIPPCSEAILHAKVTKKALLNRMAVTALNYGHEPVELKARQPLGIIEKPAIIYSSKTTKTTSQATRAREYSISTQLEKKAKISPSTILAQPR
jgi:hypothetical protein